MFAWSTVCGQRPAVMGIVNVTPDSFSDGGRYLDPDAAVAHGLALVAAGADLLDVGGESTRPGAEPVDEAEELPPGAPGRRAASPPRPACPVSIDTSKAAVAAAALEAGATIVNDVSAGRADPDMLGVVADAGAGLRRDAHAGRAPHHAARPALRRRGRRGRRLPASSGSTPRARPASHAASLCADPGIGFGKTGGAQPRAARAPRRAGRARRRAGARRTVAQDVHRRARSATTHRVPPDARRRHARHRGLGARPRRARSCACTTSRAGRRRASRCST